MFVFIFVWRFSSSPPTCCFLVCEKPGDSKLILSFKMLKCWTEHLQRKKHTHYFKQHFFIYIKLCGHCNSKLGFCPVRGPDAECLFLIDKRFVVFANIAKVSDHDVSNVSVHITVHLTCDWLTTRKWWDQPIAAAFARRLSSINMAAFWVLEVGGSGVNKQKFHFLHITTAFVCWTPGLFEL